MPENKLDVGYSLDLRRRALGIGSFDQSIKFLMSEAVQQELEAIVEAAEITSLDVERKNWLDKKSEGRKGVRLTTVARASRNSLLREYRSERSPIVAKSAAEAQQAKKALHTNIRSLAIQQCPDYFSRGRGKRHWETGITDAQMREITHKGNELLLRQYMDCLARPSFHMEMGSDAMGPNCC